MDSKHLVNDIPYVNGEEPESDGEMQLPTEYKHDETIHMIQRMNQNTFRRIGDSLPGGQNQQQPSVYETDHAFIFPPSSDNPFSTQLKNIQETLERNVDILNNHEHLKSKPWLFPIAEELVFGFERSSDLKNAISTRMHWVTLCYDPSDKKATLIDSRPFYVNSKYLTNTMASLLSNGLNKYILHLQGDIKIISQGMKTDIHDGKWTTINIMLLAQGISIDNLKHYVHSADSATILAHLGHSRSNGAYNAPYTVSSGRNGALSDPSHSTRSQPTQTTTPSPDDKPIQTQPIAVSEFMGPHEAENPRVQGVVHEDLSTTVPMINTAVGSEESSITEETILSTKEKDKEKIASIKQASCGTQASSSTGPIPISIKSSETSTNELEPNHDTQPYYYNAGFQLRCFQVLLGCGLALAALTILTCPPVAASIGLVMSSGLATGVLATSATLSSTSFVSASRYIFYAHKTQKQNNDEGHGTDLQIGALKSP